MVGVPKLEQIFDGPTGKPVDPVGSRLDLIQMRKGKFDGEQAAIALLAQKGNPGPGESDFGDLLEEVQEKCENTINPEGRLAA